MPISKRTVSSSKPRSGAPSAPEWPRLAVLLLATWAATAGAQPAADLLPRPDPGLPIDLAAEYSELDRLNNRLVFRKLEVRQGTLAVTADEAVASPADFVDSRWTFSGNVVLRSGGTEARGSTAELAFKDNVLRSAVLRGSPATFRQPRTDARLPTDGQADVLDYDPGAGRIRMTGNARLTDGPNEVKGDKIDYDLLRQVVSAGSGSGGPVRIRIMPPADTGKGAASPPPPAPPPPLDKAP